MSTENALEDQIEQALSSFFATTGGLSRFAIRHEEEDSTDVLTLPAIIIHCEREEEDPLLSGVWRLRIDVKMHTQADDTTNATLEQDWNDVVAATYRDDLAEQLTVAGMILTYAVRFDDVMEHSRNERHWEHRLTFHAWACSI